MQPTDRQSSEVMPSPTYSNMPQGAWDPLLKAGPNGLISLMTLSSWWGRGLLARTRWQDDSTNLWSSYKADLRAALRAIVEVIPEAGKKRKNSTTAPMGRAVKRYVECPRSSYV